MLALSRLVAALFAAVALAGWAQARPLDEVVASKVLHVVLYEDNEPFSWDEGGAIKGIDADIARAVAGKLGVEADLLVRMQGEKLDQDLRFNIVRGTLGGGIAGDVMFHVPIDREFAATFHDAVFGNAYFEQRVALAMKPDRARAVENFDVFNPAKSGTAEKVGVQLGTVADYFLLRYDGGALVENVAHYIKPAQGVGRFKSGEMAAILGVRSSLEALMKGQGLAAKWSSPPMPGLVRASWVLGTAVNEKSRDLGRAVGDALADMAADGSLQAITERYGVSYVPPPGP